MTGRLTTHVLDTASGRPAAGVHIEAFRLAGDAREALASLTTNADGRCDGPVLEGAAFAAGTYELVFHVADYFRAAGVDLPRPPFFDTVPIRFGVADPGRHYHVPLLISPYGYSTYRGS
ncbi:MAG: hydroxyisourate hydrolase [Kiloniellaceae bacterium]